MMTTMKPITARRFDAFIVSPSAWPGRRPKENSLKPFNPVRDCPLDARVDPRLISRPRYFERVIAAGDDVQGRRRCERQKNRL